MRNQGLQFSTLLKTIRWAQIYHNLSHMAVVTEEIAQIYFGSLFEKSIYPFLVARREFVPAGRGLNDPRVKRLSRSTNTNCLTRLDKTKLSITC